MNCEICSTKFRRLKDVIRHGKSERHAQFFCTPCALSLPSVFDVVEHSESKEHFITALATGVRFDIKEIPDIKTASFPPHNCCLLCGVRNFVSSKTHFKSDIHKYMAWLLRTIIASRKIYTCYNDYSLSTRTFICKMINAKHNKSHNHKRSLRFVCELCNLHFVKKEGLIRHLADQSHTRVEQFMLKISRIAKGIDIIGSGLDMNGTETFNSTLRPLYYCEVCCLWIDTHYNYIQHRNGNKHKNFKLLEKQVKKRKMCDSKMDHDVITEVDRHISKLVTKYGQHSSDGELVKPKQLSRKNKNVSNHYSGKKGYKMLKTSQSHSNDHYFTESVERTESINKAKKEIDNFLLEARIASYKNSSFLDCSENQFQAHVLKACQTTTSSLIQLSAETRATYKNNPPSPSDSNLSSPALEANCKDSSTLDIEARQNHIEEHPLEVCKTTSSSSLLPGAETSKIDKNPPIQSQTKLPSQNRLPAPETNCNSPSTLDFAVSASHFQRHAFKACHTSSLTSLQLVVETSEISKNLPTRPVANLCITAPVTDCKDLSTLDIEASQNHVQEYGANLCIAAPETNCKDLSTLDNEARQNHVQEYRRKASQTSLQFEVETSEADKNSPTRSEPNFCSTVPETNCKDLPTYDIEVTENHVQDHALEVCQTITSSSFQLGAETSKTDQNSISLLEDGRIASRPFSVDDRVADVDLSEEHYCELCDFLCYNSLHYGKHLMGKQHQRMRRLLNKRDNKACYDAKECGSSLNSHPLQYNCELCNVYNHSSQDYEFHLSSAVHKKNKWLLYVLKQR